MTAPVKQVCGLWLPAHETHLDNWIATRMRTHPQEYVEGKGTYQYHKLLAALKWVRNFGVAVDIGAHCGLWSMHLAKRFQRLYAFEPIPLHRDCFVRNVPGENVILIPCALGEEKKTVHIQTTKGSSGDSWVQDEGQTEVQMQRLDDTLPATEDRVDFVKLDCEGYELFALRGGEEMLKRSHPVVIVEQKPGRAQKYGLPERGAVEYLEGLGAKLRQEIAGDFILTWDEDAPKAEEPPEAQIELIPTGPSECAVDPSPAGQVES